MRPEKRLMKRFADVSIGISVLFQAITDFILDEFVKNVVLIGTRIHFRQFCELADGV